MDTAQQPAVPKTYIPEWIKLEFFNDSNLKSDIQNRISSNIEQTFFEALNEMRGDNKVGCGTSFSEITLLAMAYFYSEIFTDKIKDSYYSIKMVKGFLDANNLTPYTAIHEIDIQFYKLKDKQLFRHCWLIIQSAYFFNSEYFGHHQHIDYLNHYINTGEKLPAEHYKFDQNYLDKKYSNIDGSKVKKININEFTLVSHWYFGILFLICKELNLSTKHFIISNKDNREFNPLSKMSRQLRPLAPFKIIECDIKSAFPTFLDLVIDACLKDHVYNNLMKSRNITRGEAKTLFNKFCNSGKYKTIEETKNFFLSCGYTENQCNKLVTLTHDSKRLFYSYMTEYEDFAIRNFYIINDLKRGARLHDALLFIDDKIKPEILKVNPNCDFGYKELNRPIIKESFDIGNKYLNRGYIDSIPYGLGLISKHHFTKPTIKGEANGFRFYTDTFEYYKASFNLIDLEPDYENFIQKCYTMLDCLVFLNKTPLKCNHVYLIIKHIRENSNYIFNVRALYSKLNKYQIKTFKNLPQKRDFDKIDFINFKTKTQFLMALNKARGTININVNNNELFNLLHERITNNDFTYLSGIRIIGRKKNNLLCSSIVKMFNLLCTGQKRKQRNQVNCNPLYTSPIKSVTVKAMSLNPQQQNGFSQNVILKYERDLKKFNRLVNNRETAKQFFFILGDVIGIEYDFYKIEITKNEDIIKQLKAELISMIDNKPVSSFDVGASEFNKRYINKSLKNIPLITNLDDVFETDLNKSIFNQMDIEEANSMGDTFFKEYLEFHKLPEVNKTNIIVPKVKYIIPEIDFDI
jgi:hypothetical protein